jgi:uncharacterized delta-60 repeat protein
MSKKSASPGFGNCARFLFIVFFAVTSAAVVPSATPQTATDADGSLDSSFGVAGKVRSDFANEFDALSALALQPDGKLIIAGKLYRKPLGSVQDNPLVLMRYNSNGTLDTSFASGGKFIGTVGLVENFSAIVPLANGKILLGGTGYNGGEDFALARFNSDGTVDTTFGINGSVLTNPGGADIGTSLIVQPDGKILLAGFGGRPNEQASAFIVVRYDAAGNRDRSFGNNGIAEVRFSDGFDEVAGFALQPDGKMVLAGERDFNAKNRSFALTRLNSDGSLDTGFGSDGKVTTNFLGAPCEATAMALQPDGKIIAVGRSLQPDIEQPDVLVMARYNADGSLDKSFGSEGMVSYDFFGRGGEAHNVAVLRDGKIIVGGIVGYERSARPFDFALLRYNKDGHLDPDFDGDGLVTTDFSDVSDDAYAMAIQPDGKIILGGTSGDQTSRGDIVLARYNNSPSLFDSCIRDVGESLLQYNSATGDYKFTNCATGLTFSGKAKVKVKACKMTLTNVAADHTLDMVIKTCKGKASATLTPASGLEITIIDNNVGTKACSCQ